MNGDLEFVDFYYLMQVNPRCDPKVLERAYRYLAKLYHPDHARTADVQKFTDLTEAYKVLRNPEKRAEYDRSYFARTTNAFHSFPLEDELEIEEKTAASDAGIHDKILHTLYKRRREHAYEPGIAGWLLQEKMNCTEENFEFHIWYLKSKGYIDITEQGLLAVSVLGVDHVIAMSRTSLSEKLLIARADDSSE